MSANDSATVKVDSSLSNCSAGLCGNSTTQKTTSAYPLLLPIGVIIVIVLAAACLLLGIVYAYVYFTRDSGRTANNSQHKSATARRQSGDHHASGGGTDDNADTPYTTHMFLFRKHYSTHAAAT